MRRAKYDRTPKIAYVMGHKIQIIRPLLNQEYTDLKEANRKILCVDQEQRPHKILCEAIDETIHYIDKISAVATSEQNRCLLTQEEEEEVPIRVNKLLLNMLSSFRTYLDHYETSYSRRYGKDSEEILRYKKYTSQAFDSFFAYRFFSNLRNFVQHCGLPITEIEHESHFDDETAKVVVRYKVTFDRNELILKDKKIRPQLRQELLNNTDKIDVLALVQEFKISITKLNHVLYIDQIKEIMNDVNKICGFLNSLGINLKKAKPFIIKDIERNFPGRATSAFSMEDFPVRIIMKIIKALRINQIMKQGSLQKENTD